MALCSRRAPTPAAAQGFEFGSAGDKAGQFCGPTDIAADSRGVLCVTDRYNHRLQCFAFPYSVRGAPTLVIGGGRSGEQGKFKEPFGVAYTLSDHIIVSEWQGRRIQMLTPMGEPLLVLPVPNADSLAGVCLVGDSIVCALEPMTGRIHVLNCGRQGLRERDAQHSAAAEAGALSDYVCPITHLRFRDPVVTSDGHTYERHAIETWLKEHDTSPLTGERLPSKVLLPDGCAIHRRDALEPAKDV